MTMNKFSKINYEKLIRIIGFFLLFHSALNSLLPSSNRRFIQWDIHYLVNSSYPFSLSLSPYNLKTTLQ